MEGMRLGQMIDIDLVQAFPHAENLSSVNRNIPCGTSVQRSMKVQDGPYDACPVYPPLGWCNMILACGRAYRLPLAPAQSSRDPIDAACPTQMVLTGDFMYCIVS